ncbi:centriolin-like isoform X3 [Montipora capricornis]
MRNTADDMRQREAETEKLRQTVRNTPQTDPAYSHLQTRLAAKEQQLLQLQDEYGKLKQDHDRARARLEEEIAAVKDLEAQLATLRKANSDQDKLKEELKNIIDDLNDNLNSMKQQVAQQAKQISQLQHEKDALGQKLKAMQTQSANNKQLKDNIAKLQQQLKLNEDALERERKNCEALRRRLSDFEAKAAQGSSVEPALADAKKRLHDAEAEVARLQNALNKLKQQLQDDRRAADERLKKEQDKVSRALQAARSAGDKDREMKELAAQISALTKDNASLAERLKDAEDELRGLENLLDKEDVLGRLAELKGDINRRRSAVREPYSDQDDLGRAIRELHQKYIDLMGELEKERRKQPNGEVEGLQARLQDAERALRQAKDRASQLAGDKNQQDAKLRQMADELKRLRDKLGRQEELEDELENAKAEHAEEMSGLERQIAQLKDQLLKAKHGVQDQLANARAPLQAKIRDMEDEMQYLQDKLEKVKADNEKLKGAIKSVEAGREDLQDRLADMKEKLREARAQADEANARHDRQKQLLEDKVKALENELERARNRLQSLRAQAEERLQAEKEKAAAKIDGLEEEIDGLKSRLRRLQDKADQELDRMRDAGARQVRDLEGKMADLRNQLDNERVRADEQLRKARNKEAGLKNLLGETQAQLERTSHQSHAQQAKLQELENEIDGLRRALKEAETEALKDKLNKELEAAHAERMKMAIEAAADKQLAEAQQQISSLQSLLADKDRQLQEQLTQGTQNASDIAAQRAEIRNLASALAEQNDELERLNDDLTQMSRGPVHTQYLHNPDPSLTALAGEVEALRAALSQKEQQVANLTSPIHVPVHPPFASTLVTTPGLMPTQPPVPQMTISGLATTPGVVPSQAYVPQFTTSVLPTTPVLVPSHTYVPVVATSSMATTPAAIFTQTYVPSAVPGPAQEVVSGTSATQTVPAVSTLVTSPGGPSSPEQVHLHHHHHYVSRKSPRGVRKPKAVTLTTSTHLSPELLSASTLTPPVSSVRHHHHHYDDVSSQDGDAARRKKRKSKKRQRDVLFCNFPNHEGLEYEVGRLEGLLSSSLQAQKFQDSRDSLRMDLKDLENEVETSLKRRAASKLSRNKRHSLDGNLAAGSERVFIMKAIDEEVEEEGENFPIKYLQQSSGPGMESTNQMKNFTQEVHWDKRLIDLARVESIIEERKAELKEVDAVLTERRRQLEEIFQRCNLAEGRLRRAEEDAGVIEQRAAETSVELIRAGNQLISLEIKEKSLNDRQDHIDKTLQGKSRELKEVENACEVVRRNVDKLNQELKSKMEDLENKKSHLTEVESRIQLSLRVEELRNLVAHTEKEVKTQEQKYLQALKEGEKALEDKTCQLARTRNQIQIQMTEFHGLNSKVNRLRAEMRELQLNLRKEQEEAKRLSLRRQEEERNHELKVKEAKEKLEEVNKARNESMDALKNHREEFALLRGKIRESMTKMKECEELKQQKEVEYEEMLSSMNDEKIELENELSRLKSETQSAEDSRTQIMGELTRVATELETAMDELQGSKTTRDSVLGEINGLEKDLSDKKEELNRLKVETENASKELEREKEKITGIQARHDEMIAEMKKEDDKVEKSDKDSLPQESSTPRQKANDVGIVDKLQETVKHLMADNEEKQNALIDARAEVKELKELIESERNKAHDYFLQMASETEVFKKHIERLRKENSAERQRFSMEKESVLHKVEEHRLKARKLSEELNTLKRNHLLTKQQLDHMKDTLAKDVKELKEHIEGLSSQMRVEFARSLRHVVNSKEQTSEEIDQLREKEDEIEIQLIAIQQSIRAAKQMAIVAAKEKLDESKREKEETLLKEQGVKLVQQQTLLRDQIRQQMSSRAESLDEERKKAEVSLEGLKKKLKSLEEVITRKDSSVEDFRLKLLQSKVTAEKEADSSKQIEELKRRLREMEEEKELIQCQRNHLAELKDAVSVDGIGSDYCNLSKTNGDKLKETHSTQMCRSLDSQMDNSFHTRLVKCDFELPCRDREEMLNTSVPWSIRGADVSLHTENKTEPAEVPRPPSSDRSSVKWNPTGQVSFEMTAANNSGKKRSFDTFDGKENWTAHSFPGKLISRG